MRTLFIAVLTALAVCSAASADTGLTIRASVSPSTVGLGDAFTLTIDANAPTAGDLRILADSGPFVEVGAPRISHTGRHARLIETLACVDRGCTPGANPIHVTLPRPRATLGSTTVVGTPVTVTVVPRVPRSVVKAGSARYREQTSVSAAHAPFGLVAAAAVALAVLLAVAGLAVGIVTLRPRDRMEPTHRRRAADLKLALRLLRESAGRSAPDRRRAADLVARTAAHEIGDAPAAAATRVAWAPPEPEPHDVETLADRVEHEAGAR